MIIIENTKKPPRSFDIDTFTKQEWEEIKSVVTNHQCRDLEEAYLKNYRWDKNSVVPPKKDQKLSKNSQNQPNKKSPESALIQDFW